MPSTPPGRPALAWLGPVVYAAVLAAGLIGATAGTMRLAGFTASLLLLTVLDLAADRRWPGGPSPTVAAGLLVVRIALFAVVVTVDDGGLARLLFLLVPFHAWTAFGAGPGLALGAATLVALPAWLRLVPAGPGGRDRPEPGDIPMFILGLVLTSALAALVTRERQATAALREAGDTIAALSATAERQRLSREVHDSVAHHLTATAVQLEKAMAFRAVDAAAADDAVVEARRAVGQALTEVREAMTGLRVREAPTWATQLVDDLRATARSLTDAHLAVDVRLSGADAELDPRVAAAVLGLAREALTNVRRHARAGRALVLLRVGTDVLDLTIEDDGRGFAVDRTTGLGLRGMRERAEELGGGMEISSDARGTRVTGWIPAPFPTRTAPASATAPSGARA